MKDKEIQDYIGQRIDLVNDDKTLSDFMTSECYYTEDGSHNCSDGVRQDKVNQKAELVWPIYPSRA